MKNLAGQRALADMRKLVAENAELKVRLISRSVVITELQAEIKRLKRATTESESERVQRVLTTILEVAGMGKATAKNFEMKFVRVNGRTKK